jgi:hypothetical protein
MVGKKARGVTAMALSKRCEIGCIVIVCVRESHGVDCPLYIGLSGVPSASGSLQAQVSIIGNLLGRFDTPGSVNVIRWACGGDEKRMAEGNWTSIGRCLICSGIT